MVKTESSIQKNDFDTEPVDALIDKYGKSPDKIIPLLQEIQKKYRYLPQPVLKYVSEKTDISLSSIAGVSSFYSMFRFSPLGLHLVKICIGTACHVKGAEHIFNTLRNHLHCKEDSDTDPDGIFTLQKVACLGCCTLAPVVQIDGETYGHVAPSTVSRIISDFLQNRSLKRGPVQIENRPDQALPWGEIRIGLGSCCIAGGSAQVGASVYETIKKMNIPIVVKKVGCVGMCHQTPLLEIHPRGKEPSFYARVLPRDVPVILYKHFKPGGLIQNVKTFINWKVKEYLLGTKFDETADTCSINIREKPVGDFLNKQIHIATERYGAMDPLDIDEYKNNDGFKALKLCIKENSPQKIIEIISQSGLRGRGGGGYETSRKWRHVLSQKGKIKYIICNGDEGDPGAFMDRMLLESYPYRVLEGMIIAASTTGASNGILYIRAEYTLAIERVGYALAQCYTHGFTGKNICGSDFRLDLSIMKGAGAFVCGEETALIQSIEGKRGMPYFRPPYPSEKGLYGHPTLVNNCETYACVPWIIRNGPNSFSQIGTKHSKGTKVFSLAGKIRKGGLIEVPMGISIREIVEEIGGGIANGKQFKAVQIGGPSGGCIPAEHVNTGIDYEELTKMGSMMGSGGLVVLDDTDCMVDIARYFIRFTREQSCGRCTFCRIGTKRMLDILDKICTGTGSKTDLKNLSELSSSISKASLCGLGKTSPNPVITTLKYFYSEYESHIRGKCPAGKCKSLITYSIDDTCIGCTICSQNCPVNAIAFTPYSKHEIDTSRCIRCNTCLQVCPVEAVHIS